VNSRINVVIAVLVVAFLWSAEGSHAQEGLSIKKETVAVIRGVDEERLLGLRAEGDRVLVADERGAVRAVSLTSGEVSPGPSSKNEIIDFSIRNGKPVFLTSTGNLSGSVQPSWPETPFNACILETAEDGGLFINGGPAAFFLLPTATSPFRISGLDFGIPVKDGFLWTLTRQKTLRTWQVELLDCLGNRMKRVYRFSREFQPEGLYFGPLGPEGELLVSNFSGKSRFLTLIAQNGRMLWRIPAPAPICRRDLGWAPSGDLLLLERVDGKVCLRRWVFAAPEG